MRAEQDEAVTRKLEVKGTVGCVAVDTSGHLGMSCQRFESNVLMVYSAAATSTGGLSNKMVGRVGDSSLIGSGTYANDRLAVSCTGRGEQFIRHQVAYQLAARVRFRKDSPEHAAQCIIEQDLSHGHGGQSWYILHSWRDSRKGPGLIAVDKHYNTVTPFNTRGMYRGVANSEGEFQIRIYNDR